MFVDDLRENVRGAEQVGMTPRLRVPLAGIAALVLSGAIVPALIGGGSRALGGPGTPERVLVASTGDRSELRETVPIARREGHKRRVVMSLSAAELPRVHPGDSLQLSAELQVTTDCRRRSRRCVGRPYRFSPAVSAQLVLADAERKAAGLGTVPISTPKELRCRQKPPNRQHHCMIVFPSVDYEAGDLTAWPCAPESCSVNLVVAAHHRRAGRRHRLIIGADQPNGRVRQDKGRINAMRVRDPVPGSGDSPLDLSPPPSPLPERASASTTQRVNRQLKIRRRVVVYSQPLDEVRAGEQLAVWAKMRTAVPKRRHLARVTTKLVLGRTPRSTAAGATIRRLAPWRGEIAEDNGFNCTRLTTPCVTRKVGVLPIVADSLDSEGQPLPLYVNLVVTSGLPTKRSRRGSRVPRVRPEGSLEVVRFPPELQG